LDPENAEWRVSTGDMNAGKREQLAGKLLSATEAFVWVVGSLAAATGDEENARNCKVRREAVRYCRSCASRGLD
jgi:hypothetical protein